MSPIGVVNTFYASSIFTVYTYVQIAGSGYRLKLCFTAYKSAPECTISVKKIKFISSGDETDTTSHVHPSKPSSRHLDLRKWNPGCALSSVFYFFHHWSHFHHQDELIIVAPCESPLGPLIDSLLRANDTVHE